MPIALYKNLLCSLFAMLGTLVLLRCSPQADLAHSPEDELLTLKPEKNQETATVLHLQAPEYLQQQLYRESRKMRLAFPLSKIPPLVKVVWMFEFQKQYNRQNPLAPVSCKDCHQSQGMNLENVTEPEVPNSLLTEYNYTLTKMALMEKTLSQLNEWRSRNTSKSVYKPYQCQQCHAQDPYVQFSEPLKMNPNFRNHIMTMEKNDAGTH